MLPSRRWTTLERLERGRIGSSLLQVRFFSLPSPSFPSLFSSRLSRHHPILICSCLLSLFRSLLYRVRQDPSTPPEDEPHCSPWNHRLHASSIPRCLDRSSRRCRQRSQAREDGVQEVLPGQREGSQLNEAEGQEDHQGERGEHQGLREGQLLLTFHLDLSLRVLLT